MEDACADIGESDHVFATAVSQTDFVSKCGPERHVCCLLRFAYYRFVTNIKVKQR